MLEISITRTGPIFQDGVVGDRILEPATAEMLQYGLRMVKDFTPKRTGTARRGWYISRQAIANDVPYIKYLEYGTSRMRAVGMARTTAAQLQNNYSAEVETRLRELG